MRTKIVAAIITVLSFAGVSKAQSVVPFFQEGKRSLKSQITVMNDGLNPMPVTLEAREVTGATPDGKPIFSPLRDTTKLELRDTSSVIPPHGQRSFDFKVTCPDTCVVVLMSGMTTGKAKDANILVKVWLPSGVWVCPDKAKDCRARTKAAMKLE